MDVKPWDDETDMKALEESVRSIEQDGLVWGASKLVAIGYGIKKLQITIVVGMCFYFFVFWQIPMLELQRMKRCLSMSCKRKLPNLKTTFRAPILPLCRVCLIV